MKKHLLTISAILTLLVAGCEMFPPDESQIPVEIGTAPEIVIAQPASPESDSTFSVTIVPAEGTGYYAYLVVDKKMPDIDGSALLSQDYEGLYGGLEEMSKTESVTVNADAKGGIMPGSLYYIYAVGANTSQGNPSPVAYDSVYTTNGNVPLIDDEVGFAAAEDGSYVDFALNDVVTLGNGKIYYNVFNPYTAASIFADGKIEVPKDSIIISGKVVRFMVPSYVPHGALINVTWDEGAFLNSAKKESQAYSVCELASSPLSNYSSYGEYGNGIIFRKATTTWNIAYPNKVVKDDKGKESLVSTAEDTIGLTNLASEGFVFLTDSTVAGIQNYANITYSNQNNTEYSYPSAKAGVPTDSTVMFTLDQNSLPDKGTWMSIRIPAGALRDQWGNTNAEFSSNSNFIYSFGYSMENDLYGNYTVNAVDAYIGSISVVESGSYLTIRAISKDDKNVQSGCNVAIENLLSKGSVVYAAFGEEDGLLHIPAGQEVYVVEDYKIEAQTIGGVLYPGWRPTYNADSTAVISNAAFDASIVLYDGNLYGDPITFQLNADGTLTNVPSTWVNYNSSWCDLIFDGSSFTGYSYNTNYVMSTTMTPASTAATTSVQSAKATMAPAPKYLGKELKSE